MNLVSEDISRYCSGHSSRPSKICEEIEGFTQKNVPGSPMLSGPLVGSFLGLLISSIGARRIVEVGTYTGYSALCMAEHLPTDGELVTLDKNPDTLKIAHGFWEKSPHGKKIRAVCGDAQAELSRLEGPFDFAFIDADKGGYLRYLKAILPLLSPRGIVVADNCLWSGRVLEPDASAAEDTKAIKRFNESVASDPALQSCLVPIRDGLHLIRKR
jgi:caffeoyl-CoA O-methyltransferase